MSLLELRRLLTSLLMPLPVGLGLALAGGAAALYLGGRPRLRRGARLLALAGLLLIWLAAMPWTAQSLMRGLESDYPPRPSAACGGANAPVDAIVLLGGAVAPPLLGDLRGRLHGGSDRVREAARLFHAGCAPKVLISAGGEWKPPVIGTEAQEIVDLLGEWGVPAEALIVEDGSRTTGENARQSRAILAGDPASAGPVRILLVTSAWHLRRALPLFEAQGFAVLPVGADYRGFSACAGLRCVLPDGSALNVSSLACREHLGYWVQARQH